MASTHFDIVVKIIQVTKLDGGSRYTNGRQEDVPGERVIADLVNLAVKAPSKESAIKKVKALLDVELANAGPGVTSVLPSELLAVALSGRIEFGWVTVDTETSGLFVDDGARVSTVSVAWQTGKDRPGHDIFKQWAD
jgi:hypothetical protein